MIRNSSKNCTSKTMEDRRKHRTFIKNKSKNLWRDNFKKQCLEQFKRSRETQVNQRRFGKENVISEEELLLQIIKNEWKSFLLNEEKFTGDFDADLAAVTEGELLQELKRESSICNSRSLEEEAEYVLQFEPEEIYQNELVQEDSDMFISDNIQNLEYSQGLM
ncbi:hypothetical protein RclHR1_01720019 [Rhizophagus clarus]|uniref:RPA-interacting protein N-terminal domain-containing protein n=1 Tax=Rhizophagus clarus TaxID=94130 RepID=A0A2Z6RCK4_9GLOM|nr:hypothetical protein RclHR1_01720019 [Rhizophagus clarus]